MESDEMTCKKAAVATLMHNISITFLQCFKMLLISRTIICFSYTLLLCYYNIMWRMMWGVISKHLKYKKYNFAFLMIVSQSVFRKYLCKFTFPLWKINIKSDGLQFGMKHPAHFGKCSTSQHIKHLYFRTGKNALRVFFSSTINPDQMIFCVFIEIYI